jgi:hypothetical protein
MHAFNVTSKRSRTWKANTYHKRSISPNLKHAWNLDNLFFQVVPWLVVWTSNNIRVTGGHPIFTIEHSDWHQAVADPSSTLIFPFHGFSWISNPRCVFNVNLRSINLDY